LADLGFGDLKKSCLSTSDRIFRKSKLCGSTQYVNGSDQQEVRGVGKMVNEKYMPWTVVINILFIVDLAAILKNHISVSAHSSQITVLGCDQRISNGAANTSFLLITHQY
jgi:hypothetical protein